MIDQEHASHSWGPERRKKPRGNGSRGRYETWTKDELYHEAKKAGIEGRAEMSRQQLIDALRHR